MRRLLAFLFLAGLVAGCTPAPPEVLRLATTTSTEDSGLLDAILPAFEHQHNARVDVVAVGTGQALELGRRGDADVVLVHSRSGEDQFMAEGFGTARYDVMYNDFVLVGPEADPAGIRQSVTAAEALTRIAEAPATSSTRIPGATRSSSRRRWPVGARPGSWSARSTSTSCRTIWTRWRPGIARASRSSGSPTPG